MNTGTETRKKTLRNLFLCFIVILVIEYLFDPLTDVFIYTKKLQAHAGFASARARWDKQEIHHYRFDISMFEHNSPCVWDANLEIKDGVVIAARRRSDWPADLSTLDIPVFPVREPQPNTPFLCNYHNFTMPQLFDVTAEWMKEPSSVYLVTYDKEYGLISEFRYGLPTNKGLLRFKAWHCCNGFKIENFQALDE